MPEDLEIISDELQDDFVDNYYTKIIKDQIDFLYYFKEIDFEGVYDKALEDRIKCITLCYKVIEAAQKALLKEVEAA